MYADNTLSKFTPVSFHFSPQGLMSLPLKGTVSRELRWEFLYINQKLFSRADVTNQIKILLKGQIQMVSQILDEANIVCLLIPYQWTSE